MEHCCRAFRLNSVPAAQIIRATAKGTIRVGMLERLAMHGMQPLFLQDAPMNQPDTPQYISCG